MAVRLVWHMDELDTIRVNTHMNMLTIHGSWQW